MRPALAALAAQQKIIDEQDNKLNQLRAVAQKQNVQIQQLTRGLSAVARLTGLDTQVRTAIFKRADEQNPAQPVLEPTPEPATQSTQEVGTPEAFADVRAPGLVPGSTQDVSADSVSTAYTPGVDIPSPAINQLVDVTRPVDGAQGPRPLNEVKTLVDVRAGNPMNPQTAFPVNGPFANAQRTSSVDDGRAVKALRLAKLRAQAGIADQDDETVLMDSIVRDASLTTTAIDQEIATLTRVTAASKTVEAPRNLVPRTAGVQRTVPTLTRESRSESFNDDDAQDIFLAGDF